MAVLVMTVALLLVLLVPLGFAIAALVGNSDRIVGWVNSLDTVVLPPPPAWLSGIPLAGDRIVTAWNGLAAQGPEGFAAQAAPYIRLVHSMDHRSDRRSRRNDPAVPDDRHHVRGPLHER